MCCRKPQHDAGGHHFAGADRCQLAKSRRRRGLGGDGLVIASNARSACYDHWGVQEGCGAPGCQWLARGSHMVGDAYMELLHSEVWAGGQILQVADHCMVYVLGGFQRGYVGDVEEGEGEEEVRALTCFRGWADQATAQACRVHMCGVMTFSWASVPLTKSSIVQHH